MNKSIRYLLIIWRIDELDSNGNPQYDGETTVMDSDYSPSLSKDIYKGYLDRYRSKYNEYEITGGMPINCGIFSSESSALKYLSDINTGAILLPGNK